MGLRIKNIWHTAITVGRFSDELIEPGKIGYLKDGAEETEYIKRWLEEERLVIVSEDGKEMTEGNVDLIDGFGPKDNTDAEMSTDGDATVVLPPKEEPLEKAKTLLAEVLRERAATVMTAPEDDSKEMEENAPRKGDTAKPVPKAEGTGVVMEVPDEDSISFFDDIEKNSEIMSMPSSDNSALTSMERFEQKETWQEKKAYIKKHINSIEDLKTIMENARGSVRRAAQEKLEELE